MKKVLAILLAILMVTFSCVAFAEETATVAADTTATTDGTTSSAGVAEIISMLIPLVLMVAVFYFLLIRPQKKKEKKVKEMLDALTVGDRICTIGGIYGTITGIRDQTMEISVGRENTKLVIARWAIRNKEEVAVENDAELLN